VRHSVFFNIPIYQSAADFSGRFRLKRESRKNVDAIVSTISVFLKITLWGRGEVRQHPLVCANGSYTHIRVLL